MKRAMMLVVVAALVIAAFVVGRSTVQAAGEQTQLHFIGIVGGLVVHYPALGKVYMYDMDTSQCKTAFRIPGPGAALQGEPCK